MKNVSYYLLAGEARAAYQAWREHNEVVLAAHAAWATAALGAGAERRCVYDLNSMEFFGVPLGTKALSLVEPEAQRTIGLIVADRQPVAPLARNLLMMTKPVTDAGLPRRPIVR